MNKIFNAKLNKKYLSKIDKAERSFIFTLAHFTNEMNALNKLLLWTSNTTTLNKADNLGRLTFQFMFLRFFAGKIYEGYELLRRHYYNSPLSKEFSQSLGEEAKAALKNINKYFSNSSNSIYEIRNSLAFHYDPLKIDTTFNDAPDDLDIYIEKGGSSNNLFYFGEVVAGRALIQGSGDLSDINDNPYGNLIKEIFEVGRWFTKVTNQILTCFLEKHKENIWDGFAEEVEFKSLISTLDIQIPWFTDFSQA